MTSVVHVGNVKLSPAEWNTLRLVMVGATIKGYLNGIEQFSVSDALLTAGKAGLRFFNAAGRVDEVSVN